MTDKIFMILIILRYLLSAWIIFTPSCDELWQVVRAKNGRISSEVIKTISDNSNNNVQHDEGAEEDEGNEIDVGDRGAAALLWVSHVEFSVFCVVPFMSSGVARSSVHGRHHDIRPGLARGTPEQHNLCLENISKVVVAVYLCFWVISDVSKHLHSNNSVNEEQHQHQHHHIWKSLENENSSFCFLVEMPHLDRLHKCIEKNSDANGSSQQLDQPCRPEQPQESDLNYSCRVNYASSDCYKIECIPSVFKIWLKKIWFMNVIK